MKRLSLILTAAAVAGLAGCSKDEPATIKADPHQPNSSAVIVLNGTTGTMKIDRGPGFPNGMNQAVEEVTSAAEKLAPAPYKTRRIRIVTWKQELVFSLVGGGKYICVTGCAGSFPVEWHTEQ